MIKIEECQNCGRKVYSILIQYTRMEEKLFKLCPKCIKLVNNFKKENAIK